MIIYKVMKTANILKLFSFALVLMILSCKNDVEDTPEPHVPTQIPTVSSTAFTASVSGTIDGVTYDELNSGQRGILYNEGTDGAQTYFDSWLKGNNNPGCSQVGRIKLNPGGNLEVTLTQLKPETTYTYCLYYQSRDGVTRLLGATGTFTTRAFGCTLETAEARSVGFYKAYIPGSVKAETKDLELCTVGIVLSPDAAEPTLADDHKKANPIAEDGTFDISLNELRCGTER